MKKTVSRCCAVALFAALSFLVSGCATTTAISAEDREIVTVAESIFAAMKAGDAKTLEGLVHPDARLVAIVHGSERELSRDEWIKGIVASKEPIVERMWDPRVERNGDLASLWAPYDLHVGSRFIHCGVNAMHFSRAGGSWRMRSVTFTVQTEGCSKSEE